MNDHVKLESDTEGSSNSRQSTTQQQDGSPKSSNGLNCLDHVKRAYILLLGAAGIAFSILVIFSCEFFSYRTLDGQPWEGLIPPFDTLSAASVGLFSYSETAPSEGIELSFLNGQCIEYDNPFETGGTDYWVVAQWCAIAAPIAGFLAWSQLILEMCFCRLRCSFLLITLLFLATSGLQGCSFMIFADREFCFNAASQNQCRLESGAWFAMAGSVSYLILAILCTSIDPYVARTTKLFCCVMTRDCSCGRRRRSISGDIESNGGDKLNAETSGSSADGQNWRDVLEDDGDEDFGQSNVAAADSNLSGLNWKPTEESKDEENTQTSSMLQNNDSGLALNSASMESENHPTLTQSESDVLLNKFQVEKQEEEQPKSFQHSFPRKPDFLDMCCAGDPLQVEKHLEYPVKLKKSKA